MSSHLSNTEDLTASRRGFLKRAGLGVGVLASASALQACDSNEVDIPGTGTVRGTVTDGDGQPISGVGVTLSTGATTTTDDAGEYSFADISTGEYTVTVAATPNYPSETATVTVVRGGTAYFSDFVLGTQMFDFSNDFGVLNYAYALEQLEAAFYAGVVASAAFADFDEDVQDIMRDLAAHEAIHRDFLKAAIEGAGGTAIIDLTPRFSDPDDEDDLGVFADTATILATALTFEDLGVGAYNGAGQYLSNDTYLTIAGKIVSVEARHASVIAGLITENAIAGANVIDGDALDRALAPSAVLAAADPFIVNALSAVNVPDA